MSPGSGKRRLVIVIVAVAAAGLAFAVGMLVGSPGGGGTVPSGESDILYWTCAMDPQIKRPGPGLCPICGMALTPVKKKGEEEEPTSLRQFSTSKAGAALMDIRTAKVRRKYVTAEVRMVGRVDYDETRVGYITAWVPGRLDRLYVDYTGVTVNQGEHMVYLYSPQLLSAQEELIQALKAWRELQKSDIPAMRESAKDTVDASREKLRLLGLSDEQVATVEKTGKTSDHLTINAPVGGIVIHKNAQEGMYVQTGTRIYTLADLSRVWVKLDAYESDLTWIRYGQAVEFTTESYPGEVFTGQISFIAPFLDARTRTVKVRVNVDNPDFKLKPDMFVRATVHSNVAQGGRVMDADLAGKWICSMHPEVIKDEPGKCDICGMPLVRTETLGYVSVAQEKTEKPLVIPATAPLLTGKRAVVYVKVPEAKRPTFVGREVVLGPRAGDYYIVQQGLEENEEVVTHGNFRIDSALQIAAKPSMMNPEAEVALKMKPIPLAFQKQLTPLLDARNAIHDAVKTGELEPLRRAFRDFHADVKAVDAAPLTDNAVLVWNELSTKLLDDGLLGAEADDMTELRRYVVPLDTHMKRLEETFLKGYETGIKAPPAFQKQLGTLFKRYLVIQKALAGDDGKVAAAGVDAVRKALDAVDMKLVTGRSHASWMKHRHSLAKLIDQFAADEGIDAQRETFALLSEELATVLGLFGAKGATVYELHCPMAFNYRGANWLQDDREPHNPYFGAKMPTCGSVVQVIASP